jgi:hypothetical protein
VGDVDQPRFLAKGLGYVDSAARAMDRVECVDEDEQARQTAAAHRAWEREQRRAWGQARREILAGVERFKANGHPDKPLLRDLHLIEYGTRKLDRRLGL